MVNLFTYNQDFLLLEVLVHKAGDLAHVGAWEALVGVEDVEGAVLLEGVVMSGVEEVEVVLEEISNDLGFLIHAGHPLADR